MTTPYSIAAVLPHAGRLLLLDELLECTAERVVTAVTIRTDSVLCMAVGVPAWVGLEYMAQTVAALSGVEEVQQGIKPRIGLLLGARSYRAQVPVFPVGARLVISANMLVRGEDDLVAFACEIHSHGQLYASGDIKAIRPHNIHALIKAQLDGSHKINQT